MASTTVTFSNATAGSSYKVDIKTHSGSATVTQDGRPADVPAGGGTVYYDDTHGDNYIAVETNSNRASGQFYRGQGTVNIDLS